MDLKVAYSPHEFQKIIHDDPHRFRIVAAGRRFGKTVLAVNELSKHAALTPNRRSWYIAPTYRQAKTIAWDDPKSGIFAFLPKELIEKITYTELTIKLINGHLIEFKGAENKDKLRGVGLTFAVLDEFGQMGSDIWQTIVRPMLADTVGRALFIGTPHFTGSSHFYDLWKLGQTNDPNYKSWTFFTSQNPHIPISEVNEARRTYPVDLFKREWEADFSIGQGLVYDNFDYGLHVIPSYEPTIDDYIVGSIDPGLINETGALLTAWDKNGVCRIFKEYYQSGFLAENNAENIQALAKPYKVAYWVIDRAAVKQDPRSGLTVHDAYRQYLSTVYPAPNNPGSVLYGVNEVKKLLQPHKDTKKCKLYISAELTNLLNEIQHYSWYQPKWNTEGRNNPEKPKKYKDHLMDCLKNVILTRPWTRPHMQLRNYLDNRDGKSGYTGY